MTRRTSSRQRAEVIEVYADGSAAVKMLSGRIEHVLHRGAVPAFVVGQKGMAEFVITHRSGEWCFSPTA